MGVLVKNANGSLCFCLTVLKVFGFLTPHQSGQCWVFFSRVYCFSTFMFVAVGYQSNRMQLNTIILHGAAAYLTSMTQLLANTIPLGGIIIAQTVVMFQIWGDLSLMISELFLFFTNVAFAIKIINVAMRNRQIQEIIDDVDEELMAEDREKGIEIIKSCNRETTRGICVFGMLSAVTVVGWAASTEKNKLPLRAWYPYDATKSPAYELSYANQSSAVILSGVVNVSLDTLVTSLIAVCRCRLKLVGLSLRTLCEGITLSEKHLLTPEQEHTVHSRLQQCVVKHQAALKTARLIQECFSFPILALFTTSALIICISAYMVAMEINNRNWARSIPMVAYMLCIMVEIFLYCYQGNQLSEESSELAGAAYECPWYNCSLRVRRALLIVMVSTCRVLRITAGGFTTLSLSCFTSIIKASYTFFTVLNQVENRN